MNRSKLFGVVINPKFEKTIDWKLMSDVKIRNKLKELNFLDRFWMTKILNQVQFENVNKNKTDAQDFEGQLEIGMETCIPHYQLALEVSSIYTQKKVLEGLEQQVEGHINVDIQFNLQDMKNYCSKEIRFISEEYSGRMYKHQ